MALGVHQVSVVSSRAEVIFSKRFYLPTCELEEGESLDEGSFKNADRGGSERRMQASRSGDGPCGGKYRDRSSRPRRTQYRNSGLEVLERWQPELLVMQGTVWEQKVPDGAPETQVGRGSSLTRGQGRRGNLSFSEARDWEHYGRRLGMEASSFLMTTEKADGTGREKEHRTFRREEVPATPKLAEVVGT